MNFNDTVLGYDLEQINSPELDEFLLKTNQKNVPEIIIVKKCNRKKGKKRNWKLKHLEKEKPKDLDVSVEPLVKVAGKKKPGRNAKK